MNAFRMGTMNEHEAIWLAKLAAWTHDPAEKALVLFRDPSGHEKGTVRALRSEIFPDGLPENLAQAVRKADHWAAAADRPQFPRKASDGPYAEWAQVRFDQNAHLIHPLSGDDIEVSEGFTEDPEHLKAVSTDHFLKLVARGDANKIDARKTALAFWRFGPETPAPRLGSLWNILPADTRVPDHTIWAHLDLTSAFAGAFCADAEGVPALLVMSFGPVQDFIAQSRSTSDLWAGSHLLSRMAWEAMKVVCRHAGPDAILFPQLRGVPLVDLWLLREEGLREELFKDAPWRKSKTDSNPLFVAALPNRFVAVVPAGQAADIAGEVTERVRGWVMETGRMALGELARAAKADRPETLFACEQMERQFRDFPEVHWAAVPWSLVHEKDGRIDPSALEEALRDFYPAGTEKPGFLGTAGWGVLQSEKSLGDTVFYRPNPGVLYPALYDLLDRVSAASKSLRPFGQMTQTGYRCSLCGEREWLAARREDLYIPPGERKETLWARVAAAGESWNRKGEHLCAPCALKRLWPLLFLRGEAREAIEKEVNRYVVSTHTLALSTSLEQWLKKPGKEREIPREPWTAQVLGGRTYAALPRKLDGMLRDETDEVQRFVKALPVFLDEMEEDALSPVVAESGQAEETLATVGKGIERLFGKKSEAYYALILMDGDRMGAWISGTEPEFLLPYERFWHPKIRGGIGENVWDEGLRGYLKESRRPSPARHMAISGALNSFALQVTRYVLEDLFKGKLIYAGGDDVLAMICIDDLLPAMQILRYCYSGTFADGHDADRVRSLLQLPSAQELKIGNGHLWLTTDRRRKLLRMMGSLATASLGAVVAHHTAPLARVLRTLRETEKRAKHGGGRDAFALTVLKRGGGAVELTCPWFAEKSPKNGAAVEILIRLCNLMASKEMSRRAVYLAQEWSRHLPTENVFEKAGGDSEGFRSLMEKTLARQFRRQAREGAADKAGAIAQEITTLALAVQGRTCREKPADFIVDFISVAEFLAREGRAKDASGNLA